MTRRLQHRGMERLKETMLLSLLSIAILMEPQVTSLQIRPTTCYNTIGDIGTCMFVWECIKTEGKHLGTCADGFLFGSCCAHNDSKNNLIPQTETVTITTVSRTTVQPFSSESSVFGHEDDNFKSTIKPLSFLQNSTRPNEQELSTSSSSKPPYFNPVQHSRPTFKPSSTTKPKRTTMNPLAHTTKPSLVTIENFLTRSTMPSSDVITQKPPKTSASTQSYGTDSSSQLNATNIWFRPTVYTSIYVSTKQPLYPQKISTYQYSQTTHKTTKHPYVRPSWRPRPPSGGYYTSSKPHVFTFSNYFTTPIAGTSKTTQRPVIITKTTQRPIIITKGTTKATERPVIITKVTTKATERPVIITKVTTKTTERPVITKATVKTTQRPVIVTKGTTVVFGNSTITKRPAIKTTTRPVTTPVISTDRTSTGFSDKTTIKSSLSWLPFLTTPRPIIQPAPIATQFSWYPSPTTKSPIFSGWYNTTVISGNTLIESSVSLTTKQHPAVRPSVTPSGGTSLNLGSTVPGFSTQKTATNDYKKPSTPSPITPCGIPNPHPQKKVVGGKNSAFGSWPWQVSVRRTSFFGFSSTHRCGGALISRQWIATAGHCVDDLILSQIKIRVGEYDFASVQEPHGYVERGAKKKVVHPRYNFFTYENDLALVQLEEAIDSQKYPHISPICLPPSEESLVGRNATVTGWGRLSEGGILPSILQEVQVPIISNEKCKNMFLAAGRHEYIPDIFMCAGFEEGGRDSCQGDSGGPLQIQAEEGYWFLAGIISWGIGCAEPNMPGVCTRISKFKDWVVQHVT